MYIWIYFRICICRKSSYTVHHFGFVIWVQNNTYLLHWYCCWPLAPLLGSSVSHGTYTVPIPLPPLGPAILCYFVCQLSNLVPFNLILSPQAWIPTPIPGTPILPFGEHSLHIWGQGISCFLCCHGVDSSVIPSLKRKYVFKGHIHTTISNRLFIK